MLASTYKVLVVEDVPLLAKVTIQMLKKAPHNRYLPDHRVTLAEAVAAVKIVDYDVVLLDLNLPDSSGLETLTTFTEIAPELPVIVLTATHSHEIGLRAVKLGAQDFLLKGDFNFLTLDRAIIYSIERHRLQRTLRQLAVLDELTGLYNRRGFNTLHPDLVGQVRQSDRRGWITYFDLDRFKQINDEFGHQKGDEALAEFAANLRSIFRKDTLLVRLGGDEFVAMGIEHEPGEVEQCLQALGIVLAVRNRSESAGFTLSCSHGTAYFDRQSNQSIEDLSAIADAELYRHKESRRERLSAAKATVPEGRR
jgi:two-component system, cell cycle response regulator